VPRVGFEATTPAFEQNIIHSLDSAATMIANQLHIPTYFIPRLVVSNSAKVIHIFLELCVLGYIQNIVYNV
jgi:hypothetical protein